MDLIGQIAVVTGAGSGLGAHVVRALSAAGCHAVVADRDAEAARVVAASVTAAGGEATPCHCDVLVDADLRRLVSVADALGGAAVLVNNAGGWGDGEGSYPDARQWAALAPAERARLPALVPPELVADEVVALTRDDAAGGTVVSLLDGRHREATTPPG